VSKPKRVESRSDGASKPESIARKLYSTAAAVLAAAVARKVIERLWVKATGKAPPKKPESPDVHWAEAVGWSALSGTGVAVARLLASRRAAGAWQRVASDDGARDQRAAPPS
jgi:Protein of unknown function (DUF4235)